MLLRERARAPERKRTPNKNIKMFGHVHVYEHAHVHVLSSKVRPGRLLLAPQVSYLFGDSHKRYVYPPKLSL
jgi:hypothetical protein